MIDLISIGIAAEDGREYYAENVNFDWRYFDPKRPHLPSTYTQTHQWLWENVHPHLGPPEDRKDEANIALEIVGFVGGDQVPEFWGYYADYDWVVFCWLFGQMIDLPTGFPMFCMDLKQEMVSRDVQKAQLPEQDDAEHHALADARWVRDCVLAIKKM